MKNTFIYVQCKAENGLYDLVDGETGEILVQAVCGWLLDMYFKCLDNSDTVYVRQFY